MSRSTITLDRHFSETKVPDSVKKSDIKSIREWLKKQNHLPELTDRQVAIFLHCCYSDLELTKVTIDSYYTMRTQYTELFDNRNPEEIAETSNVICTSILPEQSPEKDRLVFISLCDENAEKFSTLKTIRIVCAMLDIEGQLHPFATGWRIIMDAKKVTFGHFMKIIGSIGLLKKVIYYVQDGLPLRLKGIHVFNAMPLINQLVAVVRPIMKKELYELIHIHPTDDIESMYPYIPQSCLPSDCGGEAPSLKELIETTKEKMETYKQWFVDDDQIGRVDESERVCEAKGGIFRFDGFFKKFSFR